jgi:cytochrome c5
MLLAAVRGAAAGCGGGESTEPSHPGQQDYTRFCFSCPAAGVAGAPAVGSVDDWAPRIAKGRETLLNSTISGMPPGMPPRGLCANCSDEELAAAVDFMIERSR